MEESKLNHNGYTPDPNVDVLVDPILIDPDFIAAGTFARTIGRHSGWQAAISTDSAAVYEQFHNYCDTLTRRNLVKPEETTAEQVPIKGFGQ